MIHLTSVKEDVQDPGVANLQKHGFTSQELSAEPASNPAQWRDKQKKKLSQSLLHGCQFQRNSPIVQLLTHQDTIPIAVITKKQEILLSTKRGKKQRLERPTTEGCILPFSAKMGEQERPLTMVLS